VGWVANRYASADSQAETNDFGDSAGIEKNPDNSEVDWNNSDAANDIGLAVHTQGSRCAAGAADAADGAEAGMSEETHIGPECDGIAAALLVRAAVSLP